MSSTNFKHLLEPIEVGGMKLKNRMVMAPMCTQFAKDGYVTEKHKNHYGERAKGGVGLIIIEYTCIDSPIGKGAERQLCCDDDKFIPGLASLVKLIHSHNTRVALQLCHAGRHARTRFTGLQPVAPSPLAAPDGDMPRELSTGEIGDIVERFSKGAERAQKAGFDGVEIHCTHGYLLNQFASSFSNVREDIYGGELRNRVRIILDTVGAVRERVGASYPVWARITAKEFNIKGGITLGESLQLAQWLEEAGVVALNVSASCETTHSPLNMLWTIEGEQTGRPPMDHPYGFLVPLAEKIKEVVSVPVMAVGRVNLEAGEEAVARQQADMVVIGRALLCDSELPNKVALGEIDDIRPCIGCNECLGRFYRDEDLHCSLNATTGREELRITPARRRKKVIVVGGGPSGLEAARVTALRGHEVVLLEKATTLGGKMLVASVPLHKSGLLNFVKYLVTQVKKLGVKVYLGKEATVELVSEHNPDVAIIATGAKRQIPDLPGLEKICLVNAEEVLGERVEVGRTVAVVGGGMVGCETAEFLARKGRSVTILEIQNTLALGMELAHRRHLLNRLNNAGVSILLNAEVVMGVKQGLIFSDGEGRRQLLACDTAVVATRSEPDRELYNSLRKIVPEVYLVGDCSEPGLIADAVLKGFLTSLEI